MKLYNISRLIRGLLCFGFLSIASCSSSGTSTPSAELPAPVLHVTTSSPDADGVVRVTSPAGFADAGTTASIENLNAQSSGLFLPFLIRSAWAHEEHIVTINADGSLHASIEAAIDDILTLTYTRDGVEATESLVVPANVPPLDENFTYVDVAVEALARVAVVSGSDGVDGVLALVDIAQAQVTSSVSLVGVSAVGSVAVDSTTQTAVVLDSVNSQAWLLTTSGLGGLIGTVNVTNPVDVASGPSGGYVLIAHAQNSPALSMLDLTSGTITCTSDAEAEDSTDQAEALFVAMQSDGVGDVAVVLSLMPDGSYLLTTFQVDPVVPSITQTGAVVLDVSTPGGLALISSGSEALVTDTDSDTLLRVDLVGGGAASIAVGSAPQDVLTDSSTGRAYVVNTVDDTVSVVDLATDTATTTLDTGLSPTAAALDPNVGEALGVVLNSGDATLILLDL